MSKWREFADESRGRGWAIILASFVGVALGLTALPFYSLGVFAKPLSTAFHWPRALVQSGIVFSMLGTVCAAGPAGWLIDRFGVRRVALVSQVGLAAGFLILASQDGDPLMWRGSWFVLAVFGIGTTPLTWSRGIAARFVRSRGFALGIALAGTGLTAFLAPPVLGAVIAARGWRFAYAAIAATIVVVGLPTVWALFLVEPTPASEQTTLHTWSGATLAQALAGYRFWLILGCFAAISFGVGGAITNLVPMLTDAGVKQPALYASLLGVSVIAGRLLAGYLLDRVWAPAVAFALLGAPTIACLLLASHRLPGVAGVLIGLAGGAEFDLIAYLCVAYFGMRSYGRIYAWQWASFSLAAGVGAFAFGQVFDRTGSYAGALYAAAGLMLAGSLGLFGLGRSYQATSAPL